MSYVTLLKKSLPASTPASEHDFAKAFFSQVSAEDLAALTPEYVRTILKTHLKLSQRQHGMAAIQFSTNARENQPWSERRTYIDLVNDDMAFLIDSVAALLGERRCVIDMLLHPRLKVSYDDKDRARFDEHGHGRQSHIHIVIEGQLSAAQQDELKADLLAVIDDVHDATRDWQAMRLRAIEAKQHLMAAPDDRFSREELNEYSEFLDYIYDNNFTFLGCREYRFERKNGKVISHVVKGTGLGVLTMEKHPAYISETKQPLPHNLQELRLKMPPVHISKVNRLSTVHRRVPLDAVTVHHFNDAGEVIGETLFVGLFTSVTYSRSLRSIPLLQYKADQVLKKAEFESTSHDGRALRHILEKYPRDELFQIDVPELYRICLSILRLHERQRIALYCRQDKFGRYVSCLVYVPRDRYDTRLRLKFQDILERELGGTCTNFYSSVDDSPLVRILYNIAISQHNPKSYDVCAVETMLQVTGRVWRDALADVVHHVVPNGEDAARLILQYADAFSSDYRDRYSLHDAACDILKVETCLATRALQLDLTRSGNGLTLKVYTIAQALVLSDILPTLENMGLRVLTEHPFAIIPQGSGHGVMMQDFSLSMSHALSTEDFVKIKPLFEEALTLLQSGVVENDTLNMLTLSSGLSVRDITILRTYVRYLRQTGATFSLSYMEQALTSYPSLARAFVALFHDMFDPAIKKRNSDKLHVDIGRELEAVTSLDHDRILRQLYDVLKASLRTNFYQTDGAGIPKPYVSVKLDSRAISFLPNPKPFREIFVYSARMEGIHLRNARIARGGIRWSDRAEDFRTEVLGLMKAQTVKNSVIVPSGAKGGFIVKRSPAGSDRAAVQAEGIECYRYLIKGLLDITDNLGSGNKIIKPKKVLSRDGDDPYLVVAADKGTATFSDIANALSLEYGHWLGDAFASGGSAGYDHKAMGITARGAWESVKRHFRERGHDTQTQPFDVIGIGDMAGDVFGNGMLLSPHIRLVGAFNHIHIFCDPTPDAARSFKERERLFRGVMGWDHYDLKLLSKGGRLYSRKDKVLDLTPEIQKRFDLPKARVSPPELIQAMLRARTDLMYLGGIGTYVKATSETHIDVGDRSNDAVRINATEVRAKVVGEGANLGFTQRARIEYAMNGGRLNADFVDNSAGVDTSDHEVNIKILFAGLMAKKEGMTRAARDKILKSMTDNVAALVLQDNYQQTQAISLLEQQGVALLPDQQRFIQDLEREGMLDRTLEFLPDDETIAQRLKAGQGLVRSELGILVSYAKIRCADDLLATDIPDRMDLNGWLAEYFPDVMQKKFSSDILKHPLRREIIATMLANVIVNRMGPSFAKNAMQAHGVDMAAVARAFVAVCRLLDMPQRWRAIESMDARVPADVQYKAFGEFKRQAERLIVWLLRDYGGKIDMDQVVKTHQKTINDLMTLMTTDKALQRVLTPQQIEKYNENVKIWKDQKVSGDLSALLAVRTKLSLAPYIIALQRDLKKPIATIAATYYPLGDRFAFSWLRTQIDHLPIGDVWAAEAVASMREQIDVIQMKLAARILRDGGDLGQWLKTHELATTDIFRLIADLKRTGVRDLAVLMVLLQRIGRLV